ncbi:MAG: hypothetical protein K8R53_08505 [Bacteroidales bacterium]|nr:hypothetical protein [Bacteroidales bacterium]
MTTQIPFQIRSLELHDAVMTFPGQVIQSNKSFHYNVHLQHRIKEDDKLIFVDTSVEILHQDKQTKLGFIKATCLYYLETLMDYKSPSNPKVFDLPQEFISNLNSISISNTRGIMFAQFKGTFLHAAILPIIDPKGLKPGNPGN